MEEWDDDSGETLLREWKKRQDHFHTLGYRDGVIAGKEASAQEGFNLGFKESVVAGYEWGLVKGVTCALACLPPSFKDRVLETREAKDKFEKLCEDTRSLSTAVALKQSSDGNALGIYTEQRNSRRFILEGKIQSKWMQGKFSRF